MISWRIHNLIPQEFPRPAERGRAESRLLAMFMLHDDRATGFRVPAISWRALVTFFDRSPKPSRPCPPGSHYLSVRSTACKPASHPATSPAPSCRRSGLRGVAGCCGRSRSGRAVCPAMAPTSGSTAWSPPTTRVPKFRHRWVNDVVWIGRECPGTASTHSPLCVEAQRIVLHCPKHYALTRSNLEMHHAPCIGA